MVTVLLAVAGLLLLVAFCVVWPPAGLLVGGMFLIGLASVRTANQRAGGDRA